MKPETEELISRYLDGVASEEEVKELDKLIRNDEEVRRALLLASDQDVALRQELLAQESDGEAAQEVSQSESEREKADIKFGEGIKKVARKRKSSRKLAPADRKRLRARQLRAQSRAQGSNPWLPLLIAASVLLLPVLYYGGYLTSEPTSVGRVVAVTEMSEATPVLVRGGSKIPLEKGTVIHSGDRIRTGRATAAGTNADRLRPVMVAFKLNNGAVVDLADQTEAVIPVEEAGHDLELIKGQLYANASDFLGDDPFGVVTEFAEVETQDGRFDLFTGSEFTRLRVETNEATLTSSKDKKPTTAGGLEEIVAHLNGTLDGPTPIELAAIWRGRLTTPAVAAEAVAKAETIKINFGPSNTELPEGVKNDAGEQFGAKRGYGWVRPNAEGVPDGGEGWRHTRKDGPAEKPMRNTHVSAGWKDNRETWRLVLPNGRYRVTICCGDANTAQGPQHILLEGTRVIDNKETQSGEFIEKTVTVNVSDGDLAMVVGGGGRELNDGTSDTTLNFIIVEPLGQ